MRLKSKKISFLYLKNRFLITLIRILFEYSNASHGWPNIRIQFFQWMSALFTNDEKCYCRSNDGEDVDRLQRQSVDGRRGRRRRSNFTLDVLNCFAGGVFLATSLLHMLPDVRQDVDTARRLISDVRSPTYVDFPMAEFVTSVGFFVVLVLEEVMHWLTIQSRDLRSFVIRFEFESAVRFDSIRKKLADSKIFESNRSCLILRSS